jgi:PKD repeat protein
MEKGIVILVAIILIAAGSGSAAYFAFYYNPADDDEGKEPPPPPPPNKKPVAFFKGNNSGIVGHELNFDANGSSDSDGYIVSYKWDFGDGGEHFSLNSTLANHTYLTPGTFVVNLTVRDNLGASDSYTQSVTIKPQDFEKSQSTILLERFGIDSVTENVTIEIFVISLWINVSFMGASSAGLPIGDAELEVIITDPFGVLIGNETKTTRFRSVYMDFYFDDTELLTPGEYNMEANCLNGALYLNYEIIVRY